MTIFKNFRGTKKKHFQFFEKHSQNVRSIFNFSKSILKSREAFPILDGDIRKNLREGILKSEKAFSTLDEKNETFQFKCVSF